MAEWDLKVNGQPVSELPDEEVIDGIREQAADISYELRMKDIQRAAMAGTMCAGFALELVKRFETLKAKGKS